MNFFLTENSERRDHYIREVSFNLIFLFICRILKLIPPKFLVFDNIWKNCEQLKFYSAIFTVELSAAVCFTLLDFIQIHLRLEKKLPVLEICVNFFSDSFHNPKARFSGGKVWLGETKENNQRLEPHQKSFALSYFLEWRKREFDHL